MRLRGVALLLAVAAASLGPVACDRRKADSKVEAPVTLSDEGGAPVGSASRRAGDWSHFDAVASSEFDKHALVGLAVAVVHEGRVVFTKSWGYEDREAHVAVDTAATRFRWGSVSKTLTAVIAARLAREGVFDFDAKITSYVPSYAPSSWVAACSGTPVQHDGSSYPCKNGFAEIPLRTDERSVKVRALGGHLGGVPHYGNGRSTPQPPRSFLTDPKRNTGMEAALPFLADKPLVTVPGAQYNYSSFGFNLLGVALEKASKKSFDDLLQAHVNAKAGTQIRVDHTTSPGTRRAAGYVMKDGAVTRRTEDEDVAWKAAGGGLISTTADFARYCLALEGDSLLTASEKATLWTSQHDASGKTTDYGFGFFTKPNGDEPHAFHAGGQEDTRTWLSIFPERRLCVVAMTNSEYVEIHQLGATLDRAALPSAPRHAPAKR